MGINVMSNLRDFRPGEEVGSLSEHPIDAIPVGKLKANGAEVSRVTYARLFAKIGTTYGAGNGTTTFNLPDYRGMFLRGWDNGRGVDVGRGLGTDQDDEIKSHSHNIFQIINGAAGGSVGNPRNGTTGDGSWNSGLTGGVETRPKNVSVLICIKY